MGDTVTAETRHGRLEYFAQDDPIGRAIELYGEWAENELEALCAMLDRGACAVDVGANIGTHALAFAQRVGPSGTVLAFEPQARVHEVLARNMSANDCLQVRAIWAGVGAAAGTMRVPPIDYGAHVNVGAVALEPEDGDGEPVPIVALDSFALERCDLIKIDAEGMGPEVLRGAAKTIRRCRPLVVTECNSVAEGAAVLQALDWAGYRTWLFRCPAYNPRNFKGSDENMFGPARETSLLIAPEPFAARLPVVAGVEFIELHSLDDMAASMLATPRYGDQTDYDRDPERLRAALRRETEAHLAGRTAAAAELERTRDRLDRETRRLEFRAASLLKQLSLAEGRASAAEQQAADARQRAEAAEQRAERAEQLASEAEQQTVAAGRQAARAEQQAAERLAAEAAARAREAELLRGHIAQCETEISALRTSTSWRITAPVRALKTTFGATHEGRPNGAH